VHRAVCGSFDFAEEMWEVMNGLIHMRRVIHARLDPEFKRNDNPTYEQLSSIVPRSVLGSVEVQIIRFSGWDTTLFTGRGCRPPQPSVSMLVRHGRARSFRRQRYHGVDLATHAAGSSGHTSRPEKRLDILRVREDPRSAGLLRAAEGREPGE